MYFYVIFLVFLRLHVTFESNGVLYVIKLSINNMKTLSLNLSTLAMMQSESPVSSNTYVMGTINLRNSK
jgi:hypothetical protein